MTTAIEVESVTKRFGRTTALDAVDLHVDSGTVYGLLGPNGAGKTTLVRVLATLLRPDAGRAAVFGHDVAAEPEAVRRQIALTGQYAAVDELLSGRENLRMFGRLFDLDRRAAATRANELLDRFDLRDAADRPAKTYSGGMRRRLDLASSLLVEPRLLFLDEPTTGLDPRSRNDIWQAIRDLVADGVTVLLTTQYLEEADALAQRIAVIDHGGVIAEGTSDDLKDALGGAVLVVRLRRADDHDSAARALASLGCGPPATGRDATEITAPVNDDALGMVVDAAGALRAAGIPVADLALRRPTLDDVFLQLTGQPVSEPVPEPAPAPTGSGR